MKYFPVSAIVLTFVALIAVQSQVTFAKNLADAWKEFQVFIFIIILFDFPTLNNTRRNCRRNFEEKSTLTKMLFQKALFLVWRTKS